MPSYWVFLASGIFIHTSFAIGAAPNDDWFNYVPYASREFSGSISILSARKHLSRHLSYRRRNKFHHHGMAHAMPGHVDQLVPGGDLGHPDRQCRKRAGDPRAGGKTSFLA